MRPRLQTSCFTAYLVGVSVLFASAAMAQVPQLIRYQGTLVDTNNVPLEGSFNLTFRVYDAASGGTTLWTETQTAVPVSRGVFNVLLGQATALTLPFDKNYWLTTQVGSDAEMSPRQRLTSVPYAYRAKVAERLDQRPRFEVDTAGTLTNGLIAYWKLDEGSGATRVDSIGGNNLTSNNTVGVAAGIGNKGDAAQFNSASSRYLSIADNADLSVTSSFTVAAWFYLDSNGFSQSIVSKFDVDADDGLFNLRLDQNSTPIFRMKQAGGSAVDTDTGDNVGTGAWHFVIGWYDASTSTTNIQLDNGTVHTHSSVTSPGDDTKRLLIGAVNTTASQTDYFNGQIDEVGFWKKVLTAQEGTDLYNAGSGNTYSQPSVPYAYRAKMAESGMDISARVYNSTVLSIPNNTDTVLTFNSERWDTDNIHSTVSNTSRLTVQTAGKYYIYGHINWANNPTGRRYVYLLVNSITVLGTQTAPTVANNMNQNINTHYSLNAGDYVELLVNQDSGGTLNVNPIGSYSPEFGMVKVP